jgi:micrococcal nuclease
VNYEYNATLIRIIDGDTVDAMIDLGFNVWIKKRIRLYGIDAPETRTKNLDEKAAGIKTKKRLSQIMNECEGKFVLRSHGVGKYGRCLGTILINNNNINNLLVKEGLAEEYS